MARTLSHTTVLVATECWCGIAHAIPTSLMRMAKENDMSVYCPVGHQWVLGGKTKAEQLREAQERIAAEQRRVKATRDLLAAEERSHSATRGHLTRTKKRVANGVCPCCNRTFKQLAAHMKNKHPEYVEETA